MITIPTTHRIAPLLSSDHFIVFLKITTFIKDNLLIDT